MISLDTTFLKLNKKIIEGSEAKLFLYTAGPGSLILSATLKKPKGEVYFATDDINLQLFYADRISLHALFDKTTDKVVTIVHQCECRLHVRGEAGILLNGGDRLFSQLEKN